MKKVITITGPSASGKSTLERMLVERGMGSIISHTTRPMRPGEVNGVSYHFVSVDEFEALSARQGFVETVEFAGNRYGAAVSEFERVFAEGKPVVVVVEPDGARQIRHAALKHGWTLLQTFVGGDTETLVGRFLLRAPTVDETNVDAVARRLVALVREESNWHLLRWDVVFDHFDEDNQADVIEFILGWARHGWEWEGETA